MQTARCWLLEASNSQRTANTTDVLQPHISNPGKVDQPSCPGPHLTIAVQPEQCILGWEIDQTRPPDARSLDLVLHNVSICEATRGTAVSLRQHCITSERVLGTPHRASYSFMDPAQHLLIFTRTSDQQSRS
jgi:hypothetical protein